MKSKQYKPRLIAFEVTRRCRYACRHCRANAYPDAGQQELTTGQCKKVLSAVADFAKPMIILTGGEPMERDDIYQLIKHGRKRRLRMVMATCGYLIDDDSIIKLKKAGIEALSFSLDGAGTETHDRFRQADGAFDAVVRATEAAKQAGVRFQINTTISKINADEVIGIAEMAKRLGAYCFNPFIFIPTGRGAEIADAVLDAVQYEALLGELLRIKLEGEIEVRVTCAPQFSRVCEQAKQRHLIADANGCMGGRGFGFISYKADVQTCGFLDVSAGNLVENGFDFGKIWLESEFLGEIRDRSKYKGRCGSCDYVGVCGGCRARAFAMTGDYLGEDPICSYEKASEN